MTRLVTLVVISWLAAAAHAQDLAPVIAECDACHGKNGISTRAEVPTIAGISAFAHEDYLLVYRDKGRPCADTAFLDGSEGREPTDMCAVAASLDEDQVAAIAAHYAALPFVAAKQQFDTDKAQAGQKIHAAHCEKCHSKGGSKADDDASILAGQWMAYLEESFREYAAGTREQPKNMKAKLDALNDTEVEALLHYYAGKAASAE